MLQQEPRSIPSRCRLYPEWAEWREQYGDRGHEQVDSITGGTTKGKTDSHNEETDNQGVKTLGELIRTNTEKDKNEEEGTDKFAEKVFCCAGNSRSGGEYSQFQTSILSWFPVAFVGEVTKYSTEECAEHLAGNVKGNLCPGKITAGSKADGNSRVDVCTGIFTGLRRLQMQLRTPNPWR